jgi:O-antigen/teichoic acid export membrane protein
MFIRLVLRVLSLAAKFGLTIAIARTLGFAAVGIYGLAVAASVIASKFFGLGFSAELNRRMSGDQPAVAIETARSLQRVYVGFYLIVASVIAVALSCGWLSDTTANPELLGLVLLAAVSEHYALEVNTYLFSIHRARAASTMLFLRTGGWTIAAIAGLVSGVFDGIGIVFSLWVLSNVVVIVWAWSLLAQIDSGQAADAVPVIPWQQTWMAGAPYYLSGVLLAGLQYVERFSASLMLPAAEVGRYVFVWSIANAVQTITYASVNVTAGPRLARIAVEDRSAWQSTFAKSLRDTLSVSVAMALGIACMSPLIFRLAKEALTTTNLLLLLILLVSFILRAVSDLFWSASIALRARRRLVIAIFAATAAASPLSLLLIPRLDLAGVAVAHLVASIAVMTALLWTQRDVRGTDGVSDA